MRLLNFAPIVMLALATTANAATWHVVSGGGGDATTIQAGINLAVNGDVVLVAPGTYTGVGNVNLTFAGKNITVTSESGAYQTIIDCQGSAQGITFANGEGSAAVFEGFTIRNGFAVKGGAVYCDETSPTIRYNVFVNSTATTSGGAVYIKKGAPTLYNNTLDGNGAPFGGGMWVQGPGAPQIYQNIICSTTAGGAFMCAGAPASVVTCNDVYGNAGGNVVCAGTSSNNFSMDPAFCGIPGSGNFFLQQTSPCTAAYSPCAVAVGALGVQCTLTATEAVTWGRVKSIYR
jgi:hypothetical protein